jgi:predicted ATPase
MLSTLVGDGVELNPLKRMVIERTEGNPFFIEEMVQALFDEGVLVRNGAVEITRPLAQLHLPPTVQGILASRIDRLPAEEKELLQTLAVIGRESLLGLLGRVVSQAETRLERMLGDLQAGEFIYEQPATGDIEYVFKHALTQEVAYNSLLIERRKLLHERAGHALESMFAEQLDDHLSELAHHYSRSDNVSKAVEYLGRAGQQAMQRSAHADAISSLSAAIDLLQRLPDGPERIRRELPGNCSSNWPLVQLCSLLKAGVRQKRSELTLACESFVSGRATLRSFSAPCLDCGTYTKSGPSMGWPMSLPNSF